jgi:hypothetical protein
MELDVILDLMGKYTRTSKNELGEEGEGAPSAGTSAPAAASGYPTVTKWETGLARSVANTIDDKVTWKSLNKITRGKANTLL